MKTKMEELSRADFARMSAAEKEVFLKTLFDEDDTDSNGISDSNDEDWVPQSVSHLPASDNDSDKESVQITDKLEENFLEHAEEEKEDESENSENDDEIESVEPTGSEASSFIAKDKTEWQQTAPYQHQTSIQNVLRQRSGPHRSTETLSISDTFKKVFTEDMVNIIVQYTNKKALDNHRHYNAANPNAQRQWKNVTIAEMYSFFGVLICAGANNSNTDHTSDMWRSTSYPLYRATIGFNRFHNIMKFLRFDDSNTRSQRKKEDKAAPIRDLWTMLNVNLCAMYKPTANLTIDEQLYPFRGRTGFTQYLPSKPARYGIKIWWICDAENGYPLHGIIYTGKKDDTRERNQRERVVKDLASLYRGSGRNICMDNYFTTLPVAKHLLSWNLTIVGTIKRNKPYIPSVMLANKSREQYSSVFGFHEKVTMCSYIPKKNREVILISTMHADTAVSKNTKKKPEMIKYYDKYKIGVDTIDQMVRKYTSQRRCSRWPVAMFYNMLDIASLATYLIYYENNKMLKKRSTERRLFLRKLSEELAKPTIEARMTNMQVMRNYTTKIAIESIIGRPIRVMAENPGPSFERDSTGRKMILGSCHICYKMMIKRRRKTRKSCNECKLPVCNEHSENLTKCSDCTM